MEFELYNIEVWRDMPKDIISDDYYIRNKDLMDRITYDIYRLNENLGSLPPRIAKVIIGSTFGAIKDIGVR
jgi:hypothetical protein